MPPSVFAEYIAAFVWDAQDVPVVSHPMYCFLLFKICVSPLSISENKPMCVSVCSVILMFTPYNNSINIVQDLHKQDETHKFLLTHQTLARLA